MMEPPSIKQEQTWKKYSGGNHNLQSRKEWKTHTPQNLRSPRAISELVETSPKMFPQFPKPMDLPQQEMV